MMPIVVHSNHIATTTLNRCVAAAADKRALLDRGFGLVVLSQTGYQNIRNLTNLSLVQHTKIFAQYHLRCTGFKQQQTIITDLEVLKLFCTIGFGAGEIFKITRLCNGVVFVTFISERSVNRAVAELNCRRRQNKNNPAAVEYDEYEYEDVDLGSAVMAERCMPMCRLVVCGISASDTRAQLFRFFQALTCRLQSIEVFNDPIDPRKIRPFCYFNYGCNQDAHDALKRLRGAGCLKKGKGLTFDWATEQCQWTEFDDTLYISNVRAGMDGATLGRLFENFGIVKSVSQSFGFAKVQFERVDDAERAAKGINKRHLGNVETVHITTNKMYRRNAAKPPIDDRIELIESPNVVNSIVVVDSKPVESKPIDVVVVNPIVETKPKIVVVVDSIDYAQQSSSSSAAAAAAATVPSSSTFFHHQPAFGSFPPSNKLYVSNLGPRMTADYVRKIFSRAGEITDVIMDVEVGGRGFAAATVVFLNQCDCHWAMNFIDRTRLGGENVQVIYV